MRRRMKNSRVILLIMKITKEAIFIILNIMLNIIRDTFLMMNKKDTNKYSISDGRNNTIFYENDGYLFEFMSDQPEETILEYIEMSGVLEYGN